MIVNVSVVQAFASKTRRGATDREEAAEELDEEGTAEDLDEEGAAKEPEEDGATEELEEDGVTKELDEEGVTGELDVGGAAEELGELVGHVTESEVNTIVCGGETDVEGVTIFSVD